MPWPNVQLSPAPYVLNLLPFTVIDELFGILIGLAGISAVSVTGTVMEGAGSAASCFSGVAAPATHTRMRR